MTSSTAPVAIPAALLSSTSHPHNLTHSFAQTDFMSCIPPSPSGGASGGVSPTVLHAGDQVDSGIVMSTMSTGTITGSTYKERNISITEDDEPTSITSDRCRYVSVCEEDEQADDEQDICEVSMPDL